MNELEQHVAKLREELRNERNNASTNERDRSAFQGSRSANVAFRPDSENIRGYTEGTSGNTENARDNDRSAQNSTKRSRQNSGRLIDNNSFDANRGSEARRTGLAREDGTTFELPVEPQKRPVGRPRKEQVQGTLDSIKKAIFSKKGSVLTKKEADEYHEPLVRAIQDTGSSLDKVIEVWAQKKLEYEIWGNITDFEAEATAKIMIKRGMKDPYAAEAVRKFIDIEDYIAVSVMAIPRIQWTVEFKRAADRERRENKH